ncbi:protein adenylyltransferase SelO [Patulibacter minatonensis]|uniref:protein adenylyltransferase SelO n=1 Tax=Patulibacter minatonensis TaxID=298163 RepID=UPI00047BE57C|nr:YdiU family protein [Patulibacter minatonensis]
MSTAARSLFSFEDTFVRELEGLYLPWEAAEAPDPRILALNAPLARELGIDPDALAGPDGVRVLVGAVTEADGTTTVAQGYAGHQFGGYSPRLGDGRALLVGELIGPDGRRRDLHLKGSGRTPFARGGDGKAAVGPMLREHVVSEAMHALGIPTTRSLAIVATGEDVARETMLPGAVLARIAASHLRVGTFQYAARLKDASIVPRLADYAIARHHPAAADAERPYLAFYEAVVEAQAALVARWMHVGFVHGVMNTDNVTISGETIDYGPCAFMDAHDPATVFSSIDEAGRYAYGNQPHITQWNLARLAEPLLPLFADQQDAAVEAATAVLNTFPARYEAHLARGYHEKLGLTGEPEDGTLGPDLLDLMHLQRADHTGAFRALAAVLRGDDAPVRALLPGDEARDAWLARWRAQLEAQGRDAAETADAMDRVNPLYIPRNHLVEEALAAATAGDLDPFERLLEVVQQPFVDRPGLERYAAPAPEEFGGGYRTFCGT